MDVLRNVQEFGVTVFGNKIVGFRSTLLTCSLLLLSGCGDLFGDDETTLDPALADGNGTQIEAEVQAQAVAASVQQPSDEFAAKVLSAINDARSVERVCGETSYPAVGPMLWNPLVAHAALLESQWMQEENDFGHVWPDGTGVGERLTRVGYRWSTAGENIAAGFGTLDAAMQAWIDSPSHCKTLMRADVTDAGVAIVPGQDNNKYISYWTMVLAQPVNTPSGELLAGAN